MAGYVINKLTVCKNEQKKLVLDEKSSRSLRKTATCVDFLEFKTYNMQDRIRMQKSI